MNIAGLNVRIMIQKNETVTDQIGNHRSIWRDYFSCWATASDQTGDESEEASQTRDTERIDFTVRYCSETVAVTSKGYRILLGDQIYNITHIDDMGFRKNSLKFKTELEVR
jgi:SPP1 family predicted phage head-tail adaptor